MPGERCTDADWGLFGSILESVSDHIAQHPAQSVLIGPHGQVFWQIETDSIGMHFSWIKACKDFTHRRCHWCCLKVEVLPFTIDPDRFQDTLSEHLQFVTSLLDPVHPPRLRRGLELSLILH